MYHSACMYGPTSSNIAASKLTRSENLSTSSLADNRHISAGKTDRLGLPVHNIAHTTLVFKIEFLSWTLTWKHSVHLRENEAGHLSQAASLGFMQTPSLQPHSLLEDQRFVPSQDASSQKGDWMGNHLRTHTVECIDLESIYNSYLLNTCYWGLIKLKREYFFRARLG